MISLLTIVYIFLFIFSKTEGLSMRKNRDLKFENLRPSPFPKFRRCSLRAGRHLKKVLQLLEFQNKKG